jgi:hypothetical protein
MEARREGGRDPARGNPGICCVGSYIFVSLFFSFTIQAIIYLQTFKTALASNGNGE